MRHAYYEYTKEQLLGSGPKFPIIVMEDTAQVFASIAQEMVHEIQKNNEAGKRTVYIYLSGRACGAVSIFCGHG